MKTCKNCKFYTGIQCHGHSEFWGECRKNKNNLLCFDDTPCLNDLKNLQKLYYEQKQKIQQLKIETFENSCYKTRYEIKCRHIAKIQKFKETAEKYIPKEKTKEYRKEILEIIKNDI